REQPSHPLQRREPAPIIPGTLIMAQRSTRISKLEASSTMDGTIREPGADSAASIPDGPDSLAGNGRPGLWAGLAAIVFLALLAGLYTSILRDLAWQWWDDSNYTHGFL